MVGYSIIFYSHFLSYCRDCTAQVLLLKGRRFIIVMGQTPNICCKPKAPDAAGSTVHPLVSAMGKGINLGNVFERKENDSDITTAAATTNYFSFPSRTNILFAGGWVNPALNLTVVHLSSMAWMLWTNCYHCSFLHSLALSFFSAFICISLFLF